MSTLRQYELIYIVSPSATDEGVAELHTQVEAIVEKFDGRIEKTENWGKRRLAYEVNHCKEGTYVLELLLGSGEMVTELERRLRVAEDVLRHLVVRVTKSFTLLRPQQPDEPKRVSVVAVRVDYRRSPKLRKRPSGQQRK